jgi:hypothetical protein
MHSTQKYIRDAVIVVVVVVVVVETLLVNSFKHSSTNVKPALILNPNWSTCDVHTCMKTMVTRHQVLLHKSTLEKYVPPALTSLYHYQKRNRERKI